MSIDLRLKTDEKLIKNEIKNIIKILRLTITRIVMYFIIIHLPCALKCYIIISVKGKFFQNSINCLLNYRKFCVLYKM